MGFVQENGARADKAMQEFFSPEFRNRLSATVHFRSLDLDTLAKIVKLEIGELDRQLRREKKVRIKVDKTVRRALAARAEKEAFGARPLARLIDEKIKEPLTDAILFGELKEGGEVRVDLDENGEFRFEFTATETVD